MDIHSGLRNMILLIQNIEDYDNDLRVGLQAFFGREKIVTREKLTKEPELRLQTDKIFVAIFADSCVDISMYVSCSGEELKLVLDGNAEAFAKRKPDAKTKFLVGGDVHDRQAVRNPLKLSLYNMLSQYTGRTLPWGSLTGVRPTKIAMAYIEEGLSDSDIVERYNTVYGASTEKAELSLKVAKKEKVIIDSVSEEDEYCLYVGIPFCPTRCLYCSFTSYPYGLYSNKVDSYLDALEKEMEWVAASCKHKRLISIYVGGGTPSSISAEHMERLCTMIEKSFNLESLREYTIEAGRPDSITFDKLLVMKNHGVTRISINPQTMNEETLKTIGRAHTPKQTVEAMELARSAGCDNINMDLIVGLPGEDESAVRRTLLQIKELKPESLTVHTLAIKRAANLTQQMDTYKSTLRSDIDRQLAAVTETAYNLGLEPYYLYRQKNMTGNLENVGYSKVGLECLYNILIMEERMDIIGLGAGSSSKIVVRPGQDNVTEGTRIDRIENCKSVDDYLSRIDEMIGRKKAGFIWERQ